MAYCVKIGQYGTAGADGLIVLSGTLEGKPIDLKERSGPTFGSGNFFHMHRKPHYIYRYIDCYGRVFSTRPYEDVVDEYNKTHQIAIFVGDGVKIYNYGYNSVFQSYISVDYWQYQVDVSGLTYRFRSRLWSSVEWHLGSWSVDKYTSSEIIDIGDSKLIIIPPWEDWSTWRAYPGIGTVETDGNPINSDSPTYRFNELGIWRTVKELDMYPNLISTGFSGAYLNALENLPDLEYGLLANISEACQEIASLAIRIKSGKLFSGLGKETKLTLDSLKTAWLAYRYSYNTTKMDIEDYTSLIKRLKDLSTMTDVDISVRGVYKTEYGTFRCVLVLPVKTLLPADVRETVDQLGGQLNAVAVWDMIPYSFVIDWFFHIGDLLEMCSTWNKGYNLEPSERWFSWATSYDNQTCYLRVKSDLIGLTAPFYGERRAPSGKTTLFRIADAFSLFT